MIPPPPKKTGTPSPDTQHHGTSYPAASQAPTPRHAALHGAASHDAAPHRKTSQEAAPRGTAPRHAAPHDPLAAPSGPSASGGLPPTGFPPSQPGSPAPTAGQATGAVPYTGSASGIPPYGATASSGAAASGVPPYGATPGGPSLPEAERTVTDGPAGTPGPPPYGTTPQAEPPGTPPDAPTPPPSPAPTSPPAPPSFPAPPTSPAPPFQAHPSSPANPSFTPPSSPPSSVPPSSSAPPSSSPTVPSPAVPGGGRPVAFVNGQATLALARLDADDATDAADAAGPALTPDAILPPGTPPEAPPEPPPHDPHATATGPIPRLGAGPGFPGGRFAGASGARRAFLVAAGLLVALLLGGGGALAVTQLSGGSAKEHHVAQTQPPAPTPAAPTPTPTPTPSRTKAKHKHVPVDIRDEKTDPKALTIGEVFPDKTVTVAGIKFVLAKTVINDHCSLAANGPFATELTREHCRRVVRATFVSADKKLAVTTGIAVMPTDAAARAVLEVQDPSHYKWFRGMKATGAPKIDQAGGYAASTLRGRYIGYAYATYADGHKPTAKDTTLKKVGTAFRDSTIRPIERRAKQH